MTPRTPGTLRVLTYNILLGGERREERICAVLKRGRADVIALQEARDRRLVHRLAEELGMHATIGEPSDSSGLNLALLSKRPLLRHRNHRHHGKMLRSHLEGDVEAGSLGRLRIHVVHLAARFGERANGEARRMRELEAILGDISRDGDVPHVIVGDFNALAPGDHVEATLFLRRMAELRKARLVVRQADGLMGPRRRGMDEALDDSWLRHGIDPALDVGIPVLPRVVGPLTAALPVNRRLDRVLTSMLQRWSVEHLLGLGYKDCYRLAHPRAHGYTCATWLPAARIDYVFASPAVGERLARCDVVGGRGWPDPDATTASDHFPVAADFHL